eukprot:gene53730-31416_t
MSQCRGRWIYSNHYHLARIGEDAAGAAAAAKEEGDMLAWECMWCAEQFEHVDGLKKHVGEKHNQSAQGNGEGPERRMDGRVLRTRAEFERKHKKDAKHQWAYAMRTLVPNGWKEDVKWTPPDPLR